MKRKLRGAPCILIPFVPLIPDGSVCVYGGSVCVYDGSVCVYDSSVYVYRNSACVYGGSVCVYDAVGGNTGAESNTARLLQRFCVEPMYPYQPRGRAARFPSRSGGNLISVFALVFQHAPLPISPVDGGGAATPSPPAGRVGVGAMFKSHCKDTYYHTPPSVITLPQSPSGSGRQVNSTTCVSRATRISSSSAAR